MLLLMVAVRSSAQTTFPFAEISNGIIRTRFYLPNADKGYYRGTRFDWSGVIPLLEYKGHSYCQQWFANYLPTTNDAIMGPVESFAPLGYDEAAAGGKFVQVGVGVLSKPNDQQYSPFKYYNIINSGNWTVSTKPASIEFVHILRDSLYAYEYKKTETLVKGKPLLVIDHALKNTGVLSIHTNVYNHNLFVFDKQPTGPAAVVTFPFPLSFSGNDKRGFGAGNLATVSDSQIFFNRVFQKGESVYAVFTGYSNSPKDYDIKIENHQTGAAVHITSDQPLSKMVFWGSAAVFCPEPYIEVNILPGKTFNWRTTYEFYTCAIATNTKSGANGAAQ